MPDDHSEVVPLLPISNRKVKRFCADDSADSRVKVGHCQAIKPKTPSRIDWAFFLPLLKMHCAGRPKSCKKSAKSVLELKASLITVKQIKRDANRV